LLFKVKISASSRVQGSSCSPLAHALAALEQAQLMSQIVPKIPSDVSCWSERQT